MRSTNSTTFFVKHGTVYKDGTCPIMGRVRVSGVPKEFSTKLKINPANWKVKTGRAKTSTQDSININTALGVIEATISNICKDLLSRNGFITARQVRDEYINLTKTEEERFKEEERRRKEAEEAQARAKAEAEEQKRKEMGISLIDYFDLYINSRSKDVLNDKLTDKTFSRYQCVRERLILFMKKEYKQEDRPLKMVDNFFVENFDNWLRCTYKGVGGKSLQNNTVMKLMQKLCTVVTLAHDTGVIPINPFKVYKFEFDHKERVRLTGDEVFTLFSYKFASESLQKVSDSYLFGCMTGLAYIDAFNVKDTHISIDLSGKKMICMDRHKTKNEFIVPLMDIPLQIIEKYKGKLPDGQLVPMFSNQVINRYLKEIANIVGINKHLTYHTARHTFATYCLTMGVPLESVQKMLGHSDIRTTQIYAKVEKAKLTKEMIQLENKVNELMKNKMTA